MAFRRSTQDLEVARDDLKQAITTFNSLGKTTAKPAHHATKAQKYAKVRKDKKKENKKKEKERIISSNRPIVGLNKPCCAVSFANFGLELRVLSDFVFCALHFQTQQIFAQKFERKIK